MQRTEYLGELWQDITFTGRQLRKNPGFTAVAVLTLALGIGGTTAIFSAVYAVVLQPLPLRDPARLMLVGEIYDGTPRVMSVGNYVDANEAIRTSKLGSPPSITPASTWPTKPRLSASSARASRPTTSKCWASGPCWGGPSRLQKTGREAIAWWCSAIACGRGASAAARPSAERSA